MKQRLFAFVCLLFSCSLLAKAELSRISVDDGLPNASIYELLQDKQGYIWLGSTNTGLMRYNGYRFETFPIFPENTNQARLNPDIDIMLLTPDEQLWLGTWGMGLSQIDTKTGARYHYSTAADSRLKLKSDYIQALFLDSSQRLWIGSQGGIQRLDTDGSLISIGDESAASPLASQRIWAVTQTEDGVIWLATSDGVHAYQEGKGLGAVMRPVSGQLPNANEVRAMYASANRLFVAVREQLFVLSEDRQRFLPIRLTTATEPRSPIINALLPDGQGALLIATFDGVLRIDLTSLQLKPFSEKTRLLEGINIRSLLVDRSGVLWAGSREKGLFHGRVDGSAFSDLSDWGPAAQQLANEMPTAVLVEEEQLWLGTSDSLYRISRLTHQLQSFPMPARVNVIHRSEQGQLLIGTDVGLWRHGHGMVEPAAEFSQQPNRNVRSIVSEKDGTLWLNLWQHGVLALRQNGQSQSYLQEQLQQQVGDAIQAMARIGGYLWLGTRYSGVYLLDFSSGQLKRLTEVLPGSRSMDLSDIQCIAPGPTDTVLLCSGGRLLMVDVPRGMISDVLTELTDQSASLVGAYTDPKDNIWLMSSQGLMYKPNQQQRLVSFARPDGLKHEEMVFNAWSVSTQGELFLGTAEGLAIVQPDQLWLNEQVPEIQVSAIRINQHWLPKSVMQKAWSEIELNPEQNLELELASLDFHDPQRNQFLYRLEGVDQHWIRSQGKTSATYSQLAPGVYQFWLTGSNQHGLFNPAYQSITIRVLPQWWQRTDVRALVLVLLLMLVFGVHGYRLRHIRQINRLLQQSVQDRASAQLGLETMVAQRTKELEDSSATLSLRSKQLEMSLAKLAENNKQLTRLNRLKDEFISVVSHELRTPLTSIRGAIGLVASGAIASGSEQHQHMLATALHNAERLSALINDLLDVQKFESGQFQLSVKDMNLIGMVEKAIDDIQPYADRFQVVIQSELQPAMVCAEEGRVRQVLDNLLSNAIKFSDSGKTIQVRMLLQGKWVRLEVEDQGCGISDEFRPHVFEKFSQADSSSSRKVEGTGLGLTICKSIIEAHKGRIGFISQPGQGSIFWFELPLLQST